MASLRNERLQADLKRRISEIIAFRLRDPRLRLGSVLEVKLSPDRKVAEVRVSCLGGEADRRTFLRGLKSAKGKIRSLMGRGLRLRTLPELVFRYDPVIERSVRLSTLIRQAVEEDREAQRARGELPADEPDDGGFAHEAAGPEPAEPTGDADTPDDTAASEADRSAS